MFIVDIVQQILNVLLILSVVFVLIQVLTLLSNLYFFPKLKSVAGENSIQKTKVSILIPVRNEIDNLPETLDGIVAQHSNINNDINSNINIDIIILDDESTDGTSDFLKLYAEEGTIQLIQGQALPQGWGGKNWACHQLSQVAKGDILIFTDADVFWQKDTLASLLNFMDAQKADFVSLWPKQITKSFYERLTVPIIDTILLACLPYLGVKYSPLAAFSAGNGQLMMWRRDCYDKVGGHTAFKDEVLEDVRMGQAAKRVGGKVALAVGGELISTRMYRSRQDVLQGFSKNILAAHSQSRIFLVLSVFMTSLSSSFSWLLVLVNPLWLLPACLSLGIRFLSCAKTGRNIWEFPLQALVFVPLFQIAGRALRSKGAYVWKARQYS